MSSMAPLAGDLSITRLHASRVLEMIALQDSVCRQLPSAELYFPLTETEMNELVGPDAMCVGVEHANRLVAFFGILLMGNRTDNVGGDLGISDAELPLVTYFKATNVLPEYRGNGLQKRMTGRLFDEWGLGESSILQGTTPSTWYCATVSPRNLPSLKSFLDCGFWIAGLKPKFLGHMRYLMMRKRANMQHALDHVVCVPIKNYNEQISLLDRGWRGVKFDSLSTDPHILYTRSEGH